MQGSINHTSFLEKYGVSGWKFSTTGVRFLGEYLYEFFPEVKEKDMLSLSGENGSVGFYILEQEGVIIVPPGGITIDKEQLGKGVSTEIHSILKKIAETKGYKLLAAVTKKENSSLTPRNIIIASMQSLGYSKTQEDSTIEIWEYKQNTLSAEIESVEASAHDLLQDEITPSSEDA